MGSSRPGPARNNRGAYAEAGVDLTAAEKSLEIIKPHLHATRRPGVLADLGPFAGLLHLSGFQDPVLASTADGVGTKLKIAIALDRHDTVGLDLVHHCANDILTAGAEPLFFLDYLAMGRLVPEKVEAIVGGVARGCVQVGCALIGGETAEMPGLYAEGDYDLVGFMVGAVERDRIIDGRSVEAGDAILGLPSSGLHTNGYSLVRRIFGLEEGARSKLEVFYPELGRTLGEELLEPHRPYWPRLKPALPHIKGLAHITGGGLPGNIPRILPEGLAARLRWGTWPVPPIFSLIQRLGQVDDGEMRRVFNLGLGMVLFCSAEGAERIKDAVPEAIPVGEVVGQQGEPRVILI